MRNGLLAMVALLTASAGPLAAQPADPEAIPGMYPASWYDEDDPWRRMPGVINMQSGIQPSETVQIDSAASWLEPISSVSGGPLANASSVGRLTIQYVHQDGRRGVLWCTGTLVSHRLVLTNHHCVPGTGILPQGVTFEKAYVRFNYQNRGENTGSDRYNVIAVRESNRSLDYALLELEDAPDLVTPVKLGAPMPRASTALYLIHHPMTLPTQFSRYGCRIGVSADPEPTRLYHTCSSYRFSSGAPLFSVQSDQMIALHRAGVPGVGGANPTNEAVRMSAIYDASPLLRALAEEGNPGAFRPAPDASVFFEWDRTDLTAAARNDLSALSATIAVRPPRRILIVGHTDTEGAATYNLGRSARMARTVADALVSMGADAGVISVDGVGETQAGTPDGVRDPDSRRVDIYIDWQDGARPGT